MNTIANLTHRKNKLIAEATSLIQEHGLGTSERKEQHRKLLAEIDIIQGDLDMLTHIERSLPADFHAQAPVPAPVVIRNERQESAERRANLNSAWRAYITGKQTEETRTLLTTTGGGATVGVEFNDFSVASLKAYAPLMNFVRFRNSYNGRAVRSSVTTDTGNGMSYVPEGASVPEIDPGSIGLTLISTDTLSAGIQKFSTQLASDATFDLTEFLTGLSSVRYGRGIQRAITLGTDQSNTSLPNNPGLVNIASVAVTTGSLASNVTFPNIADLYESLDSAYYPKAVWQMNAATRVALIKTFGTDNRSLFVPAPSADGFDLLFGHPLLINSSLPSLGTANGIPILFGDLYNGIEVVGSLPKIITLNERYITTLERAIILRSYVGSAALASDAIRSLRLAAA